jgi:hypothetical protein
MFWHGGGEQCTYYKNETVPRLHSMPDINICDAPLTHQQGPL